MTLSIFFRRRRGAGQRKSHDGVLLQIKTCPDGTTTYDYDVFGNLRGVTLPNGTAITYLIDGQNRRVGKKVKGTGR